LTGVNAHADGGIFFRDHAFDDSAACADAAAVLNTEHQQIPQIIATKFDSCFQSAQRRFTAEINLAAAFIRGNHKAVLVAQGEQIFAIPPAE
jgi:predicted ATP-grasp superfamily ATP-dependent carboligase